MDKNAAVRVLAACSPGLRQVFWLKGWHFVREESGVGKMRDFRPHEAR